MTGTVTTRNVYKTTGGPSPKAIIVLIVLVIVVVIAAVAFAAFSTFGGSDTPAVNQQGAGAVNANGQANNLASGQNGTASRSGSRDTKDMYWFKDQLSKVTVAQDNLKSAQENFKERSDWFIAHKCSGKPCPSGYWEDSIYYKQAKQIVDSAEAELAQLVKDYKTEADKVKTIDPNLLKDSGFPEELGPDGNPIQT